MIRIIPGTADNLILRGLLLSVGSIILSITLTIGCLYLLGNDYIGDTAAEAISTVGTMIGIVGVPIGLTLMFIGWYHKKRG